ncbi:MAG: type IV conjugative transfer system protein TraL [Geminicoccaceae bacterium]
MTPLPHTADDPPYFLLWRMGDSAPPTLMLAIDFLLDAAFLVAFLGLLLGFFYQRYREGKSEMFVLHAMYWYGARPSRGRNMRNPLQQVYLP